MKALRLVEVPEEPRLPRARGARQQPRKEAIQERTQECMTAVMTEGIAPCRSKGILQNLFTIVAFSIGDVP